MVFYKVCKIILLVWMIISQLTELKINIINNIDLYPAI